MMLSRIKCAPTALLCLLFGITFTKGDTSSPVTGANELYTRNNQTGRNASHNRTYFIGTHHGFSSGQDEASIPVSLLSSNFPIRRADAEERGSSNFISSTEPTIDDMLDFMEKNLITYGDDILQNCVDDVDVKAIVESRLEVFYQSLKKLLILTVCLFSALLVIILGILIYLWRSSSNTKTDTPVMMASFSKRKLTNESDSVQETQHQVYQNSVLEERTSS